MSVIAEVLALPFTPPDKRTPLGYYPHVMQPHGPARTLDGRRPEQRTASRPRRSKRQPRVLWAVATFSEKRGGGGSLNVTFVLTTTAKRAVSEAEKNVREVNPRNFNFQSVPHAATSEMVESAFREGASK